MRRRPGAPPQCSSGLEPLVGGALQKGALARTAARWHMAAGSREAPCGTRGKETRAAQPPSAPWPAEGLPAPEGEQPRVIEACPPRHDASGARS